MKTIDTPLDQSRIDAFVASGGVGKLHALIEQAAAIAQGKQSWGDKADAMVDTAEHISQLVTPFTPCTKGCNHCCHMAVIVSSFEAEMIGRYLGRNPANAGGPPDMDEGRKNIDAYTGDPCPLLAEDGKCSVYPVRPIACRTHHNMGADETNCIIAGRDTSKGLPTTPMLNITDFMLVHALVFVQGQYTFADIRDWFPKKSPTP